MHVVECPSCHRKFKVSRPVIHRPMKCSRCGRSFVGSSHEAEDGSVPVGPPPPPAGGQAPPAHAAAPAPGRRRRGAGPVALAVTCVLGVGIIALVLALWYALAHPRVEVVVVPPQGQPDRFTRGSGDTFEEPGRLPGAADPSRRPPRDPGRTTPPGPDAPAPDRDAAGDPALDVSIALARSGVARNTLYIVGRLRNNHDYPLEQVTLTAFVSGVQLNSRTMSYVPANGSMLYSISLGNREIAESNVKVIARGQKAPEDRVIWALPAEELDGPRPTGKGEYEWTGWVRNPFAFGVTDVQIYLDYYDEFGVRYDQARGGVEGVGGTLASGKTASCRIATKDFNASQAGNKVVVRVVGRRM